MPQIKVLSVDPSSFRNMGCAVAVITSEADEEIECEIAANTFVMHGTADESWTCLWPLFNIVDHLIASHEPDVVIIEKTSSFSPRSGAGFITGQVSNCIGVILACCGKHEVDVEFCYPTHIKKIVTGKGKATKTEMRKNVIAILNQLKCSVTKFDSEHAYDAVANILTFMHECKDINFTIERPK